MEINDVLIASYIDGTATIDERNAVRKYLCAHPEMYARVLFLMDSDREDYLNEVLQDRVIHSNSQDDLFSDLEMSSAAFAAKHLAPQLNNTFSKRGMMTINNIGSDRVFCENEAFHVSTYRTKTTSRSGSGRMKDFWNRLGDLCAELDEIED